MVCANPFKKFLGLIILFSAFPVWGEGFKDWRYRMPIETGNWLDGEPLTNFPVLVVLGPHLSGFNYSQFESEPFGDLRFSDASETNELPYEVELWDPAGTSYVWVRVPVLTNGTRLIAYWGKSDLTAPAYTTNGAVWTNQFGAVYHLSQSPTNPVPQIRDSTANTNHGVCVGSMTAGQLTNGIADGALRFDGVDDYVNCGNSASLEPTKVTFSCWFRPLGPGSHNDFVWTFTKGRDSTGPSYGFQFSPNNQYIRSAMRISNSLRYGSVMPFQTNSPITHFTATYDGTNLITYRNGQLVTVSNHTGTISYNQTDRQLHLGANNVGSYTRRINGILDEVRICRTDRSSNWVWATYLNMASNNVFFTYGPVVKRTTGTLIYIR